MVDYSSVTISTLKPGDLFLAGSDLCFVIANKKEMPGVVNLTWQSFFNNTIWQTKESSAQIVTLVK